MPTDLRSVVCGGCVAVSPPSLQGELSHTEGCIRNALSTLAGRCKRKRLDAGLRQEAHCAHQPWVETQARLMGI